MPILRLLPGEGWELGFSVTVEGWASRLSYKISSYSSGRAFPLLRDSSMIFLTLLSFSLAI